MGYNYEYPYFDAGNYNSDWLINKMKELEETVIGLETFKFIGENEILDLNQQNQNSIAAFTSNFNVLNSPVSNVQRVTVTYGSETAYIQQLYDLSTYIVYTRNYSTASGWTAWKMTQNKPGTNIHTTPVIDSGNLDNMEVNTATIVNGNNVANTPTNNWGFVITWNADNLYNNIQLWFDMTTSFCYIRIGNPSWQTWLELNHIDLSEFFNYVGTTTENLNNLHQQTIYLCNQSNPNLPPNTTSAIVITIGERAGYRFQRAIALSGTFDSWSRISYNSGETWGGWTNLTQNDTVLHRINSTDMNSYYGAVYGEKLFNAPLSNYGALIGLSLGYPDVDTYQIGLAASGLIFSRFRNNKKWGNLYYYQHVSSTRALTITSTPEEHSTDAEGNSRYIMGENMYSEAADSMYNTYISLPGQSFLHSDEGKQSFKDAILAADLSDTDVVMTNLEMWDMDIPLDTIAEEVAALSDAITAKNPMCKLTLLSIPPIDIPLWGDELLDYPMPNGSTLRQVDDRLFRLSEDHAFTYVSFEYFYDAQNVNLMEYLGEDVKTNNQYLRRVGSFIKQAM